MNIWHVCSLHPNPMNGMANVIPMHVREQGKIANVVLMNLNKEKLDCGGTVPSLSIHDMKKMKFKGMISEYGVPDLVVFHGIYSPQIWVFYLCHIKGKYPYVVVPHGSCAKGSMMVSRWKKKVANHMLVYNMTKKAMAVQFLGKSEMEMADTAFYNRYILCPNGIEEQNIRVQRYSAGKPIVFTYIGRLDIQHKGLDLLLEGCAICRDYMLKHNAILKIYGGFEYDREQILSNLIDKYELNSIVTLSDAVYGEEKRSVLTDGTTYFIMTSRYEGQPMAALEALSYGVPVILSEAAGFKEEIQEYQCGFSMKGDPKSIADAIRCACEHVHEHSIMSENALRCVSQFYWDNVSRKTLGTYDKLLSEKRTTRGDFCKYGKTNKRWRR